VGAPPSIADFLAEAEAKPQPKKKSSTPPPFSEFLQQAADPAPSITPPILPPARPPVTGPTIGPARERGFLERASDAVRPITDVYHQVIGDAPTQDPILAGVAKDAGDGLKKPLIKFSEFLDQGDPTTVGGGIVRGLAEGADALTTPENLAFAAATAGAGATGAVGKAAGQAAGGAFTVSMLDALRQQVPEAYAAYQSGDLPEAARLAAAAGLTGLFAGAGAKHTLSGKPRIMEQPLTEMQAAESLANTRAATANTGGKALKREAASTGPAAGKATTDPILQQQLDKIVTERKAAALPPAANPEPGQPAPRLAQQQRRAKVEPEETAFDPEDPANPARPTPTPRVDPELVRIAKELDLGEYDQLPEVEKRVVRALREEPQPQPAIGELKGVREGAYDAGARKQAEAAPEVVSTAPLTEAPKERTLEASGSESQATSERAAAESGPVQQSARPSGRTGRDSTVLIPGSDVEHPVRYALREFDEVAASHSGLTFSGNDRYKLKNERNYSDPANQERIIKNAQKFNPRYMITDNPDAVNGPPVIDSAGNTIGGNSRVMTLERVYESGGDAAYREQLQRDAAHYGLDPAEVAQMKRPVLVREISDEHLATLAKGAQTLVRDTNKKGTAELTAAEQATADAQSMTPEASKFIQDALEGEGADASLRDLLASDKGLGIVNKLVDYGTFTTQEKSALLDAKTGVVTAAARDRIEKMMLGRMFRDSDQFQRTPPAVRDKLMKIVSPLAQTEGKGQWDIKADVQEAMDILERSRAHGIKDLDMLTAQSDMFGNPEFSPRAVDLAHALQGMSTDQMRKAFKAYAEAAEIATDPTPSMFGTPDPGQAFADSFGAEVRQAQKRLKARSEKGSFSNKPAGGPSPLEDLITVGRAAFRRGAVKVSQFRKEMIEEFGRAVERYIVPAWQRLTAEVKESMARAKAEPERGSLRVNNPAAKPAPPAPPKGKKAAIDEAVPEGDRVKTSPSYDETKGKILEKLAVSDATRDRLATSMSEWEAKNPERQVVSFDEIRAEARALDPSLIAELKVPKAGQTLDPAVRFAARETLNGLQDELVAKRKQLAELTADATPEQRAKLERQADSLDTDAQRLLDVLIPTRSQDGRNLAYHRMMAEKSFDPTYWLSRARSKAGGVLPDKVRGEIEGILAEGRAAEQAAGQPEPPKAPRQNRNTRDRRTDAPAPEAPQPRAKSKAQIDADPAVQAARRKLAKKMVQVEKSTIWETISALRKAGLLTGVKTHARNLVGNASFQVLEEVRRVPSAIADVGLSLFSGERTVLGPDFAALREASKAAATKGWREAKETWADGATREQLEQFDTARELNSGWGPLVRVPFTSETRPLVDAYVNQTFRLLGAEDRIFKAFAFERSIQEQMKVAKRNGKPVDAPTATMIGQAMGDAEVATFNNANLAADAVTGARQKLRQADTTAGRAALFGFDTVVPFVKTPTNIIARVIEYAGGGVLSGSARAAHAMVKKSLTPEQQRAISISFGRGATGLGLIYTGYQLASNGFMTGGRAEDPGRRNTEEAAGRPAGAILVDGKWRQVGSFSPAGNLLVIGATLQREAEGPLKDELKRPAKMLGVGTKTVLDQPLLTGASGVVEALQSPATAGERMATSTAGSFVPTLVNDIGTLFDEVRRDSRGETLAQGVKNAVKARLPGLRNTLPARVDVLGREQKQEKTAAVDPTLGSPARTDPVSRELVETKASLSGLKRKPSENAAGFRARSLAEGRMVEAALRELLADPGYRAEAPETRREIITKTISGLRAQISRNILNTEEYQQMKPSEQVKLWQDLGK
jgi:hypothetical protein